MEYFGDDGDRLHMMFNFQVNQHLFYALAAGDTRPLVKALDGDQAAAGDGAMGHVSAQSRRARSRPAHRASSGRRCSTAFGPDKDMQLYDRGIRRRLAPMLGGDRRRLELAYSLMFTLPGTPVIRYGDEIGMGDDLSPAGAQCARTPMQWSTEPHAGFTSSDEAGAAGDHAAARTAIEHVNVAAQRRDPDSLLNWTERMHPHAQGGAGDRLGRLRGHRGRPIRRCW